MKKEQLYQVIGEIKDEYLKDAQMPGGRKRSPWIKWCTVAASLAAVLVVAFFGFSGKLWGTPIESTEATEETAFGTRYIYRVDSEPYCAYMGGKVIDPEYIGEKLEDVTVTAGWITDPAQEPKDESLRGEIYEIVGISPDIAVALWFTDKGDALTTTHYYVILNPGADLSPMQEYVIPDIQPDPGEE